MKGQISRRDFLKLTRNLSIGLGVADLLPYPIWIDDSLAAIPASKGYLLVDSKKCQGCMSCMLTCSLAHEGCENLSFSRIQVIQNPFARFSEDITVVQCRQCVSPTCVEVCPTEALKPDPQFGYVRNIDKEACIGCLACVESCPFSPSRALFNFEKEYALKCDLCSDTPFWKEFGGPKGKQACVEVCPVRAIRFSGNIPLQEGDTGYEVNLRKQGWRFLGYTAS